MTQDKLHKLFEYIEANTLRLEASRRGGGIEINAGPLLGLDGAKMSAYQNYLGGGMLAAVQSSRNFGEFKSAAKEAKALELAEALKRYFHGITNEEAADWDEWSAADYEQNQARPASYPGL